MTVETAPPLQTKWGIARLGQNGYYRITSKKEGNCDKLLSESRKGMLNSLEIKLKMSKNRNKTGFFRVHQMPHKECKQGFSWRYEYYDDTGKRRKLNSVNLNKLKKKVLAKGKIWEVINIDNAKLTCEKYDYNLEELM